MDLLLVTKPENVRYLSGFAGSNGQVTVGASADDDRLLTDPRYEERAASEAPGLAVLVARDPFEAVFGLLDAHPRSASPTRRRIGLEAHHLTWTAAERARERASGRRVEVVATEGLIERLRAVKDEAEVARLTAACELTVAGLTWLFDEVVRVGVTERGLAVALERRFIDAGADGAAFPSIVASGPHAAIPHHAPTDRPISAGDLLTVDCGARLDGYHADCTRTVAIGHVDDHLAEVHALVEAAQSAGRRAAVVGAAAGDVDAAARSVIDAAGYGEQFVHGTGHGVGLEIHEDPAVAAGARATLVPGTALTVEPGVYLPGIGGVRIEDTIVVTADGSARPLTETPRQLRVLPG